MKARDVGLLCAVLSACSGNISGNRLLPQEQEAQQVASQQSVQELPGFADERGGGLFADPEGKAVRLRVDGSLAPLESHPGNMHPAGAVRGVFAAGPFSALVAAETGLYMAESGWLIEPPWSNALDAQGVLAAALGSHGVAWIAHQSGLFRVEEGELSELKLEAASLPGATHLAVAPAADGAVAVWFLRDDKLGYAKQTGRARFEVLEEKLDAALVGEGILGLVGLTPAPSKAGELWLLTKKALRRRQANGWLEYETPGEGQALLAAGRYMWMSAGDQLFRYDADAGIWSELSNLEPGLTLLAAEPSGCAWVRSPEGTVSQVRVTPVPRVLGLFEGARVVEGDLAVRARFLESEAPDSVVFAVDDGPDIVQMREAAWPAEAALASLDFAAGGFDAAGREQTFSLAGLDSGLHTLSIRARYADREVVRRLHFDFRASAMNAISYQKDIQPIFEARCARCHENGTARELSSYEQWVAEKERIVSAVVELRMPADGPLDPAQIQLISRWASGGSAP